MMNDDIQNQVGAKPTIFAGIDQYCAFAPRIYDGYYCIDSRRRTETTLHPERLGCCDSKTFVCPEGVAKIPKEIREEAEKKQKARERKEFLEKIDEFFEKIDEINIEVWIGEKDNLLHKIKGEKEIDLGKFEDLE